MDHDLKETLSYVVSLTYPISEDISSAILMLLLELGFRSSSDGFGYLRQAILIRCERNNIRLNAIYQEIVFQSEGSVDIYQVEQAILSAIRTAWITRDKDKWDYFFSERKTGKSGRPSNKEFISEIACIMELWQSCCKEVRYGIK